MTRAVRVTGVFGTMSQGNVNPTGVDPLGDPNSTPWFGTESTAGVNAHNAPGDGHSIWLVGADASNVGGSPNDVGADMSYGVTGIAMSAVPEPATIALVGGGLLALGALRRRRATA